MANGSVVVVGGTQGMGSEIARSYADEGRAVIVDRQRSVRAEAAAKEIGGNTRGIGFDLEEPHTIAGLEDVDDVDHLVLAAIARDINKVLDYDIDAALRLVTLKIVGFTEVTHVLAPRLRDGASILIFGGLARDRPYPGSTTVTTVNGGVTSLARTLVSRARAHEGERDTSGHRRRQPAVARHDSRTTQGARGSNADRASCDDGGGRGSIALSARERGDQRHQPRGRRRLDVHVTDHAVSLTDYRRSSMT